MLGLLSERAMDRLIVFGCEDILPTPSNLIQFSGIANCFASKQMQKLKENTACISPMIVWRRELIPVAGADSARSKVRPLVTDEKPFYSDITAIELWALDVDGRNPLYHKRTVELEDSFG